MATSPTFKLGQPRLAGEAFADLKPGQTKVVTTYLPGADPETVEKHVAGFRADFEKNGMTMFPGKPMPVDSDAPEAQACKKWLELNPATEQEPVTLTHYMKSTVRKN